MITAFIDESLRRRPNDDCVYAMAAVMVDSAHHDDLRATLDALRFGKSPRLHWRDEPNPRRFLIAQTLSESPISNLVTVYIHSKRVRYALLWAADAVVSATTWWLDGKGDFFEMLAAQTQLICVN